MEASAVAIQEAYQRFIEKEEGRTSSGKRDYVYASTWSPCARQMTLEMTNPEVKPPFEADTLARFRKGKDRERDLLSDLTRVGRECDPAFEVVGGQERFELRDKKGRIAIVGKVDARLKFNGSKGAAPLEIKSWNQNLTARIQKFEDLFENRWTRKGGHQLLAYLLASNEPKGYMLLDRPGLPLVLEVDLFSNLARIEDFLQRAEIAVDAKESGELPPFITDPEECRICVFYGRVCDPPMDFGDGAKVFTDPEVIEKAERYKELEDKLTDEEWAEFSRLDKWKGQQFRGVETGVVGGLLITGKWKKGKEVTIPEAEQADVNAKKIEYDTFMEKYTIENPKKQFSVNLIRVSDVPAPKEEKAAEPKEPKKRKKKGESDGTPRQGTLD